jgi:thiol-disulfide isomerase/thioredoxin
MKFVAWLFGVIGAMPLAIAAGTPSPVRPITIAELTLPPPDTVTIIVRNFWATWCKPCIEEMPIFDTLARRHRSIRVELVSVDAPRDSAKVRSFWRRRGFAGVHVFHLREQLRSKDIDAIASEWSGAIPVTIVSRGSRRIVHEGQLDYHGLEALIRRLR